jgi:hypothetical protein
VKGYKVWRNFRELVIPEAQFPRTETRGNSVSEN